MPANFIDLTPENLADEHLCCIIRSKKPHSGVEAKRQWLAERLREGHVFRKLDEKGTVFIEYAPLETAWWWGTTTSTFTACGSLAPTRGRDTAGRCWSPAWLTPGQRGSPACACWGRRSRRRGSLTSPLPGGSALSWPTPRRPVMRCWPSLWTAPSPASPLPPNREPSTGRS